MPQAPSLPESHGTVAIPVSGGIFRKFAAYAGPGFLVAVGYMDPGNWATDLVGGAKFGYSLLCVIALSNFMAMLLQHLCVKLGVVTGYDLAQACRAYYPKPVTWFLWLLCEIAIAACDLAEIIGSAIGLQLLFHIPLMWGCLLTCFDVMIILYLQNKGFRYLEALIVSLVAIVGGCFVFELIFAKPDMGAIATGLIPTRQIIQDKEMLYLAIGIIGATVMPHNLYLHSAIVQTRAFVKDDHGRRQAIFYGTLDTVLALGLALFVNASILICAAAAFHWSNHRDVADIQDAYKLLSPILGASLASTFFAVALLASGQSSTITGTLAGQIVMEGFLDIRLPRWLRRLITRGIAVIPAVAIIGLYGESKATDLLIASQVILSLQLGFAVWPLLRFTSSRHKMGGFANGLTLKLAGYLIAALLIGLNLKFLFDLIYPMLPHRN